MNRSLLALLVLLTLFSTGGANCIKQQMPFYQQAPQAPRLLPDGPSLDQVMGAVNTNTGRVQSYNSSNARIGVPGMPSLRANIALEQPRRFRLRADTAITGPEVDLGSNEEQFWFWVRRGQPPAVFFCRHDQFAASSARHIIPVDPQWLIEALGLVHFDSAARHSGPRVVPNGRLEVRSDTTSSAGDVVKITVVDAIHAWVLEQHVYTPQGTRLASAIATQHRYDPVTLVALPTHVEVQMPASQLNLSIDTGDYRINVPVGDPQQLWARPSYQGYQDIDLAALPAQTAPASAPPPSAVPTASQPRPRVPGLSRLP